MFKVSFKDTPENPLKTVLRKGNSMYVGIEGIVALPEFFKDIPQSIYDWITKEQKLISGEEDVATQTFVLRASGKAVCHKDDKFDYVFGERLAEARAKMKIYKFFYALSSKLYVHYSKIMFGDLEVIEKGNGDCLAQIIKKYEALCIRESHHIDELLTSKSNG